MSARIEEKIGIVGLGYVGLPLAVEFAAVADVVGFDVSESRVAELMSGIDSTGEVEDDKLQAADLQFTTDISDMSDCTFIIVTVPTPLAKTDKIPDLTAVREATKAVGGIMGKGAVVVYESTVYPGVTEEICLPILEAESGMKLGEFGLGYSPERINPGDKEHRLSTIVKVVSGNDEATLERVAQTYGAVITAGVHRAPNIKTAEAAKVIENVQRDLNIALMNELSMMFNLMGLRTSDVIEAAATKWNFHRYAPGLVGGHCIGVDPYYLTHRAIELGYEPDVILAGRNINDSMGHHVGETVLKMLTEAGCAPSNANIWVLGVTFKENVPDFRNTRAVDVVAALRESGAQISCWEPLGKPQMIKEKFGLDTLLYDEAHDLDAVILINGHNEFDEIKLSELRAKMRTPILFDVKSYFDPDEAEGLGFHYQSL